MKIREEGHYTIKRVDSLPKRGNANLLYVIKGDSIKEFYRWLQNGTYEKIEIDSQFSGTIPEYTLAPVSGTNQIILLKDGNTASTIDLTPYLDDTNLARLISGTVAPNGIATFTRDDNTTFTVDFSPLTGGMQPTKTSDLTNDGENGTDPFLSEGDLSGLNVYDSIQQATAALGVNKLFVYSNNNIDGVPSPNSSVIGITK